MAFSLFKAEVERAKVLLDMTNKDIAEKAGFSEKYVEALINGRRNGQKAIEEICRVLGILDVLKDAS